MATETSSIDDLLMGSVPTGAPHTPEEAYSEPENEVDTDDGDAPTLHDNHEQEEQEDNESNNEKPEPETDDYGNEKPAPRTYTEDEVNERINKAIRERLARGNNQPNQQPAQQQQVQQQVASGFEYNPDSSDNWQVQLEQFVEQTVGRMSQKQIAQHQAQQEEAAEAQFRDKFTNGMSKFSDFYEVVSQQPVNDAMTLALRGINDPAAFIYAASKRHPAELQRISQLRDPYAQIAEMGKLEERMRKTAQGTNAPRPLSRTSDDATVKFKEKDKEPSIEDLIAKSEAKKLALLRQKRGR